MQVIRRSISTYYPIIYSQGITIAVKYSLKRRQFKNQFG